jgi:hypothetical protein
MGFFHLTPDMFLMQSWRLRNPNSSLIDTWTAVKRKTESVHSAGSSKIGSLHLVFLSTFLCFDLTPAALPVVKTSSLEVSFTLHDLQMPFLAVVQLQMRVPQ